MKTNRNETDEASRIGEPVPLVEQFSEINLSEVRQEEDAAQALDSPKEETSQSKTFAGIGGHDIGIQTVQTTAEQATSSQLNELSDSNSRSDPSIAAKPLQLVKDVSLAKKLNNNCPQTHNGPTVVKSSSEPKDIGHVRHIVALLALSSIVLANANRQAFNQSLVGMTRANRNEQIKLESQISNANDSTDRTTPSSQNWGPIDLGTRSDEVPTAETDYDEDDDRFDWTGSQIGALQAAFSYGYTPFMIPGGRMSELYGAKWVVFLSGFGSALCSILTPFLADTNYELLVASRVLMGLCQTGVSPALYALLTRWLPPEESSVYLPMIKVAVMVGFMLGSLVSGFFAWRSTFHLVGLFGLLWSATWTLLVSSDPSEHKLIGERELDHIQSGIMKLNEGRKQSMGSARKAAAPWLLIFTNPVVVAFMFAKFACKLSTDAQAMQIPMYLKNVFNVSKELNGVLSAVNFAIQGVFTGLVAWLAKEFVIRRTFSLDKTGVRRVFQGTCNFGMGLAYILMTFNMSSLAIACSAVIMLSFSSMFGAGGEAVLPVDLSTEFSASIMAIANSSANLSGIFLPTFVSFVLADEPESSERWNLIWRAIGLVSIVGGLVFVFRVKAEIQDFRKPTKDAEKIQEITIPTIAVEMKQLEVLPI